MDNNRVHRERKLQLNSAEIPTVLKSQEIFANLQMKKCLTFPMRKISKDYFKGVAV